MIYAKDNFGYHQDHTWFFEQLENEFRKFLTHRTDARGIVVWLICPCNLIQSFLVRLIGRVSSLVTVLLSFS